MEEAAAAVVEDLGKVFQERSCLQRTKTVSEVLSVLGLLLCSNHL
jgi:hypothetical protein